MRQVRSVIVGPGCHIPAVRVTHEHFANHQFRGPDGKPLQKSTAEILKQFEAITGIHERQTSHGPEPIPACIGCATGSPRGSRVVSLLAQAADAWPG